MRFTQLTLNPASLSNTRGVTRCPSSLTSGQQRTLFRHTSTPPVLLTPATSNARDASVSNGGQRAKKRETHIPLHRAGFRCPVHVPHTRCPHTRCSTPHDVYARQPFIPAGEVDFCRGCDSDVRNHASGSFQVLVKRTRYFGVAMLRRCWRELCGHRGEKGRREVWNIERTERREGTG